MAGLALSMSGVCQLLFGVGNRAAHRIMFVVDFDAVTILRVRHHAQDEFGPRDVGA